MGIDCYFVPPGVSKDDAEKVLAWNSMRPNATVTLVQQLSKPILDGLPLLAGSFGGDCPYFRGNAYKEFFKRRLGVTLWQYEEFDNAFVRKIAEKLERLTFSAGEIVRQRANNYLFDDDYRDAVELYQWFMAFGDAGWRMLIFS